MKFQNYAVILILFSILLTTKLNAQKNEILTPVPFNQVMLEDNFWLPRLQTQAETLVPFALGKTLPAVDNLRKTAKYLDGDTTDLPFPHRYIASDLYKVMEGAAYLLQLKRDPALEKQLDDIIDIIAEAQQNDGYLYEAHITGVSQNHEHWGSAGMGDKPYSWVVHSHELYNMGHMYEAAVAYHQATGKEKWLSIAEKNARHINKVFFEGDPNYNDGKPVMQAPGHQEIELALVKLYRETGNDLYLNMARKFLEIRGATYRPEGEGTMAPEYAQQHLPLTQQDEAVGHAVRAAYLYTGMADVDALGETPQYREALDKIWRNIVDTRMHITGGLGAVHGIEGFGPEYELPNKNAYNETCAAVGNVFFNYRMFLAEKDAKYIDVAEVALYNNALAGVNLDGNKFFYVNPLETDGETHFNHGQKGRSSWFGTACCPTNIARLIPQVSGMMYAHSGKDIYFTFYASNSTVIDLEDGKVEIRQQTNYPFDENIRIEIIPENAGQEFNIKLRIPTWAVSQFVPGELYRYSDNSKMQPYSIRRNGFRVSTTTENGFVTLEGKWQKGDVVNLSLPMPVHFSVCDQRVEANRNRKAVTRGPLVYCAEATDNEAPVGRYFLPSNDVKKASVSKISINRLGNIPQISLQAKAHPNKRIRKTLKLIPYFLWDNRGDTAMSVWIPANKEMVAEDDALLKNKNIKSVEASFTYQNDKISAVYDGKKPKNSYDRSIDRWTSWPQTGKPQQIEIEMIKPLNLQSIGIYWYDDNGGVKIPAAWNLEYMEKGKWNVFPIYVTDFYSAFKDQYNVVHPCKNIKIEKLRINMTPQEKSAVGILDVLIEEISKR
ncbi:MAG: glycoside hydrolase family 127 protein [Prolixibacteraceae bacterium]|nr:glycoside hydrolase family 127 protein [Prolixibacteraceae bacterium]